MSINLEKYKSDLIAAWKDVLDEKTDTNWALFGYDGLSNDLKFVSKGDGGLTELIDDFNSGKIQYAFLKVDMPNGSISKYVLINWQGEGAPTVRKGTCANHMKHVSHFFTGHHATMHARTEDDLDENVVLDKLAKAGSAFTFKSAKSEELPPSGPVGTAYQKVNPGPLLRQRVHQEMGSSTHLRSGGDLYSDHQSACQAWYMIDKKPQPKSPTAPKGLTTKSCGVEVNGEAYVQQWTSSDSDDEVQEINSKERDQFWLKEEEEEKKRVETERKRREEEKRKAEEEVKRRDELEAAKRATAVVPEEQRPVGRVGVTHRSAEARQVIGSTAAARAVFEQNLAIKSSARSTASVPEKPARSSVIAQRINAFSQNPQPTSPIKFPISLEPKAVKDEHQEQPKTSPLKNIDKIKMSLETPSQIQYEPIIDPADLSPSTEEPSSFSAINYSEYKEDDYREISDLKQSEPMIKQNILENDMFDASYSSSNENDDDDSDNKFSTIKRSPYSKNNIAAENEKELSRQNTVIENVNYKKENGNGSLEENDTSPEGEEEEGVIYEDLDDPGLTARALYDYQAADESEITFDPGDIITHIEQIDAGWWQGLGPRGLYGLFPANYVELLPARRS